ncbi:unnamed protein product [Amaranthus hypochondriacus]
MLQQHIRTTNGIQQLRLTTAAHQSSEQAQPATSVHLRLADQLCRMVHLLGDRLRNIATGSQQIRRASRKHSSSILNATTYQQQPSVTIAYHHRISSI